MNDSLLRFAIQPGLQSPVVPYSSDTPSAAPATSIPPARTAARTLVITFPFDLVSK